MTIRWGIIGCGDVCEVKSGPGFQNAAGSALVAVMRRDGAKAADFAHRHGVPQWSNQADSVIQNPDVDAVYIATPPGSHLEYARQVCAAGKPAYIEKPMARSQMECVEINRMFAEAGLPVFVAFYRRALPRFLKTKELLETGAIGKLTGIAYRFSSPLHRELDPRYLPWRVDAEQAGGGVFLDLGCHTLDILDFLVGPLQNVHGRATNRASPHNVEDGVVMTFSTQNGALGTGQWNFAGHRREDVIELTGTEGSLSLSTFGNDPVQMETQEGADSFDLPNPRHIQQPLIQTLVDQLHGKGTCPSTGESGARTAQVMDTVLADYYGGRDDAFWTRPETWKQS